jgi:hypothetical protein
MRQRGHSRPKLAREVLAAMLQQAGCGAAATL